MSAAPAPASPAGRGGTFISIIRATMRTLTVLLATATVALAQPPPALPTLVRLEQAAPRAHPKLKLPKPHTVGPVIPGLMQGVTPQGLAFWERQNWFLVSCYFPEEDGRPSVVVAIDAKTGKLVRCLTLVEASGRPHAGHVGGLAVSDKYLWVGSGRLYRVPLADVVAAQPVAHLRLQPPFHAECNASYIACHDKRVWIGEFVSLEDGVEATPGHFLKDRNNTDKYAWIAGYALDADENLSGTAGGNRPPPAAILSVRQKVQGLAFLNGRIVLSASYGRTNHSTLAAYTNPLEAERDKPHRTVKVGDATVPVWFLDGKNREWEIDDFPPMSEGIAAYGRRLGVIFESGAAKYQKGGHGPIDTVLLLTPPAGK